MKNIPLLLNHTSELFSLWYNKELIVRAADKIKRSYFQDRRYLGSKDRKFIELLYFDMIRNLRLYLWQINKAQPGEIRNISPELITVHAFKRLFPQESIKQKFKIDDKIAIIFNSYEYREILPDDPAERWSLPPALWEHIKDAYDPAELELCLPALLQSPGVHIRTNSLKTNTPALMEKLKDIPFQLGNLSPDALRLDTYANLTQNPLYKSGFFDFQDESSQLVAFVCNPKKDDIIVDLCAGAGGKTLHLAALQGDMPSLIATDKYSNRLRELGFRAMRLGIRNIQLRPIEKINTLYKGKVNTLLIDAPCSGSGVYGRHPDRKWEFNEERLTYYIKEQRSILAENASLIKPGGYLVYATCSIIPEENVKQIEHFLSTHPDFELVSVYDELNEHGIRIQHDPSDKYLQILPHQYQSDGFFISKLKRIK
ncbi:MAG: RsmB/NOP family class I SAM-dependent RNA methyltransferase [Candidatus Marinimicrobia bacterium]|nr:RsmB/NOP family class I SAM-dependent RNA methyltransferase [Candidatus Neomarinimicrobiota bacterium]